MSALKEVEWDSTVVVVAVGSICVGLIDMSEIVYIYVCFFVDNIPSRDVWEEGQRDARSHALRRERRMRTRVGCERGKGVRRG